MTEQWVRQRPTAIFDMKDAERRPIRSVRDAFLLDSLIMLRRGPRSLPEVPGLARGKNLVEECERFRLSPNAPATCALIYSFHQTIRPSRTQKWLRHPVFRHTDGCKLGWRLKFTVSRQCGLTSSMSATSTRSRQPQGQMNAAAQSSPSSRATTSSPVLMRSGGVSPSMIRKTRSRRGPNAHRQSFLSQFTPPAFCHPRSSIIRETVASAPGRKSPPGRGLRRWLRTPLRLKPARSDSAHSSRLHYDGTRKVV